MRPNPTKRAKNPTAAGSYKLAWSICGIIFGVSLFAIITTALQNFVWVRHHASAPPPSLRAVTVLSQWAFGFSVLGILILAVLSILRAARNK